MILQSLVKYYDILANNNKVPKYGWSFVGVSYSINLSEDGHIKGIILNKYEKEFGKEKIYVPKQMIVPEHFSRCGQDPDAYFLCDNSKFILGIDIEDSQKDIENCLKRFNKSKKLHLELLEDVDNPLAKAICNFYKTWNPQNAKENEFIKDNYEEITSGANLIFCMSNENAQDDEDLKMVWDNYLECNSDSEVGICSVTGKYGNVARIHKKIKGVPGAQSTGASLVSFNSESLESYGKAQSYNAPVIDSTEFAYTTVLNYLLANKEYKIQLGDVTILFWSETENNYYEDMFSFTINSTKDNQSEIYEIFQKIKTQRYIDIDGIELDMNQNFCILGLSANVGRLSIQFFYENTFGEILSNIKKHYDRLNIVAPKYCDKYLSVYDIVFSSMNLNAKEKPVKSMISCMFQSIISDLNYPERLYTSIIGRIRAEVGNVNYTRASFIKAFLVKNRRLEGEKFIMLNEDCKDVSYLLGRLFSILESVQLDSMQKSSADGITTIKDKYFNSACKTPASIFSTLMMLSNAHMKKLDRDNKGKMVYYDKIISSILAGINSEGVPKVLSLEEQGKFILGYYHQTQKKFEKKTKETENKCNEQ